MTAMIGKVEIGVGRTDAMLREAQRRVKRAGWANVDLLESDVADDEYSGDVDREKGALHTCGSTQKPVHGGTDF